MPSYYSCSSYNGKHKYNIMADLKTNVYLGVAGYHMLEEAHVKWKLDKSGTDIAGFWSR